MRGAMSIHISVVGMATVVAMLAFAPSAAKSDEALSPAAQRGQVLVRTHCGHCHSIDKVSESPLRIAPPLRELHLRYPVEDLEEPLAEGIITGHPTMPEYRFDSDQIGNIIAYLKWLEH